MSKNHFDIVELKSKYQMSDTIIKKILYQSSDTLNNSLKGLNQYLIDKDLKSMTFASHKMKEVAITICCKELSKQLSELDTNGIHDEKSFSSLLERINQEITLIQKMIQIELGE